MTQDSREVIELTKVKKHDTQTDTHTNTKDENRDKPKFYDNFITGYSLMFKELSSFIKNYAYPKPIEDYKKKGKFMLIFMAITFFLAPSVFISGLALSSLIIAYMLGQVHHDENSIVQTHTNKDNKKQTEESININSLTDKLNEIVVYRNGKIRRKHDLIDIEASNVNQIVLTYESPIKESFNDAEWNVVVTTCPSPKLTIEQVGDFIKKLNNIHKQNEEIKAKEAYRKAEAEYQNENNETETSVSNKLDHLLDSQQAKLDENFNQYKQQIEADYQNYENQMKHYNNEVENDNKNVDTSNLDIMNIFKGGEHYQDLSDELSKTESMDKNEIKQVIEQKMKHREPKVTFKSSKNETESNDKANDDVQDKSSKETNIAKGEQRKRNIDKKYQDESSKETESNDNSDEQK